jgi:hypothetical protein
LSGPCAQTLKSAPVAESAAIVVVAAEDTTMSYKLFSTEAEAQEKCAALNAEAGEGFRFIVDKEIGGQRWVIVRQQERQAWSFAGFLQDS